ncbi:MAG TPA: ATP-binding protein, partial [Kofleriaceae bacterium]|nr:ATP-binding protein [Kofleriaceae bacterium]
AERLAALGTLAAGIAHEINNPLTYVRLNLGRLISFEAAQRPRTPDHLHRLEILNECREGVGRVEAIVRDLRLFARAEEGEDKAVRLVDAVEAAIRMAEHEIRPRARLAREFRAQPVVRGNEGRLVQVFLNVLVNAAQAIEEGHAHLNRIRVSVSVDERGWGIVEVTDSGGGMSEDVRKRAFEPFFTTKAPGAGTGLGLSLCQSVVARLGGTIDVEAGDEEGTMVRVALPPAELVEPAPTPEARRATIEEVTTPRRRILIVDDEREIAAAVAAILAPHHDVSVAGSGREAIEILRRDDDFDLILCDVTMPEIGGREVYELLRLTRPPLAERIVFMTGGAYTPQAARFISSVPNPTIEKPFDIDELLSAVEQLLGPAPQPPERRRMM